MRQLCSSLLIATLLAGLAGCQNKGRSMEMDHSTTKPMMEMMYTCPMHPTVMSDKPGKCPICGMDLVAKK